jgi:hypothetical protein
VTIRISRKKGDEQDEREAEKFLHHWVGNAAYRIQILAVNWANLSLSSQFQSLFNTAACSSRSKRSNR